MALPVLRHWGKNGLILTTCQITDAGDLEILVKLLNTAFFSRQSYSGEVVAKV